nr:tetratricopeptide repeat protein [Anaerolinea sp.]
QFRLGQPAAAMAEVDSYVTVLESSGQRSKAIEVLENLLKETGSNLDVRRRLADQLAHVGRVDDAVAQLDAVADAYAGQNKMMEAINILETIISLKPSNVEDYRLALEDLRRQSLRK